MNSGSNAKFVKLLKDALQNELQLSVNVFDKLGRLVSGPKKMISYDIPLDVKNWAEHPNRIIPVFDDGDILYFIDCGKELPQNIIISIKMFVQMVMGFNQKELGDYSLLRKETDLVSRMLAPEAWFYYDSIVATGMELGYNIKHPMAVLVTSLEGNRVQALNMDLGFEAATNEAKHSAIKMLKNHVYMNKQDVIALVQNTYLIILKAIEDVSDRAKIYQAMEALAEGVNNVLKSHRIFNYYIAPAEIVEDFTSLHVVFKKTTNYISYAKTMNLEHPIINTQDILYHAMGLSLPEEFLVKYIRPKAQELLSKNREYIVGLIQCFDAFVENGFNVATAANATYVHRNTIKKRLDKIYSLTGFDPTSGFHGVLVNRLIFQEYMLISRGAQ